MALLVGGSGSVRSALVLLLPFAALAVAYLALEVSVRAGERVCVLCGSLLEDPLLVLQLRCVRGTELRFELGEGIEKKQDDLAAGVAELLQ